MNEISHQDIYERQLKIEKKVDCIEANTQEVVTAFKAAKGAFVVLDAIGKVAKPILWIVGVAGAIAILWGEFWKRQ